MLDYFAKSGVSGILAEKLEWLPPEQEQASLAPLLDAFRCIDALRALEVQLTPQSPPDEVTAALLRTLAADLDRAATAASDTGYREHLAMRAEAVRSGAFEPARRYGANGQFPLELILGPVPSWRVPGKAEQYSAILATPIQSPMLEYLDEIDALVLTLAQDALGPSRLKRSFESPVYSVCNLLAAAGDMGLFPQHSVNFLPEDEGHLGETTKTLVYINIYLRRYRRVTQPLLQALMYDTPSPLADSTVEATLLIWLRAHDLGHSYFDSTCRRSGLADAQMHALREVFADCVGFTVAGARSGHLPIAESVLLGEMYRYARRDASLHADALAAQIELGWLQAHAGDPRTGAFSPAALGEQLMHEMLNRISLDDPVRLERVLRQYAHGSRLEGIPASPPSDIAVSVSAPSSATRGRARVPRSCSH